MDLLQAGILGIVEGITEFLPISSTGHMILASNLLGIDQSAIVKSFEIVIQLGAIGAVVVLYYKKFFDIELLKRLVVAFIPTGIIGFTIYPFFKAYLIGNLDVVVWALFLGGLVLIAFEYWKPEPAMEEDHKELTYMQCVIIGLCQAVSIIPGVSRSAATIVGGQMIGITRMRIVEFSFLLAVPTMLAATGYDTLKNIHEFASADMGLLAVGFITAFVVALFGIKFFLKFIRTNSFVPFGIYRIAVAVLFYLLILR